MSASKGKNHSILTRSTHLFITRIPALLHCGRHLQILGWCIGLTLQVVHATPTPSVHVDTLRCGSDDPVYCFTPANADHPLPALFFCHGIGASDPETYAGLISHLTAQGFFVAYLPYNSVVAAITPEIAYTSMWEGAQVVMHQKRALLDTTRIGFVGHSYGAGAVPWLAHSILTRDGWGARSAFMVMLAPWYVREISTAQLRKFPGHVQVSVQVYSDDLINDYRIALNVFNTIEVAAQAKRFVTVYSNLTGAIPAIANHDAAQGGGGMGELDCIDSCAIFPLINETIAQAHDPKKQAVGNRQERPFDEVRFDGDGVVFARSYSTCRLMRPQWHYRNFYSHAMNTRLRFGCRRCLPVHLTINTPRTVYNYLRYAGYRLGMVG